MYGYLLVYAESFALALVWVELLDWLKRRGSFLSRTGAVVRDLLPFVTFLVTLPLILPGRGDLVAGLSSIFVLVTVGGFVSEAWGLRTKPLPLLELGACVILAHSGTLIHFLASPLGGYVFLNDLSLPLTVVWLFVFAQLFKLANRLSGLFAGLVALFSYLVIGALLTQRSAQAGAAMLAVALAGTMTCLWLSGYRHGPRRMAGPAASLWSLTAAVLTVVSTSKRVAFVAIVTPLLLVLAPLLFFSVLIGISYFGPHVRRGDRSALQWNLTTERLVNVVMIFCLMGNLILLGHLFVDRPLWTVGLVAVALTVFLQTARLVLVRGTTTERSERAAGLVNVLGTRFLAGGMAAAVGRVRGWLDAPRGAPRLVITPDALALLRSLDEPSYCSALQEADMVVPDGAGVVWAGDILTEEPALDRIPGVELVDEILAAVDARGQGVFLLGTRSEILERAAAEIRRRHERVRIVGCRDGFFTDGESDAVVDEIVASGADVLLVAMGVPKQELWMTANRRRLPVKLMIGVGGTLDVMAGHVTRAPSLYRKLGLEWLHRIIEEPWRLKRALLLPVFVFEVLRQKIRLARVVEVEPGEADDWCSQCHP